MKVLVLGATGATGHKLVEQLIARGIHVTAIVRNPNKLSSAVRNNANLVIATTPILESDNQELVRLVKDCDAVISCLGHNISFKGIWGAPYLLVTNACKNLCRAITSNDNASKVKFILMNTVGNRNRDLNEKISLFQFILIGIVRLLVPPHRDNEKAADFLRTNIGSEHQAIEWVAVRPDTLINSDDVSDYELLPSPTKSIFGGAETSRINVAHFMAELVENQDLWKKWKGQMPVIYNKA